MNENMTRDQLALAATESDIDQYIFTRTRAQARYAFADAMIKARGDVLGNAKPEDQVKEGAIPSTESQVKWITGWIVIRNGRQVASDVLESVGVAIRLAKRRANETSRDVYSVASVGSFR